MDCDCESIRKFPVLKNKELWAFPVYPRKNNSKEIQKHDHWGLSMRLDVYKRQICKHFSSGYFRWIVSTAAVLVAHSLVISCRDFETKFLFVIYVRQFYKMQWKTELLYCLQNLCRSPWFCNAWSFSVTSKDVFNRLALLVHHILCIWCDPIWGSLVYFSHCNSARFWQLSQWVRFQ